MIEEENVASQTVPEHTEKELKEKCRRIKEGREVTFPPTHTQRTPKAVRQPAKNTQVQCMEDG